VVCDKHSCTSNVHMCIRLHLSLVDVFLKIIKIVYKIRCLLADMNSSQIELVSLNCNTNRDISRGNAIYYLLRAK